MGAIIIAAFVNDDVQKGFPAEQGILAIWAEVFGFKRSFKTIIDLKIRRADLAAQLGFFFAVVVIQVYMRSITKGALFGLGGLLAVAYLDGLEWSAVLGLISLEERFVI